jgi:hypothetical protein
MVDPEYVPVFVLRVPVRYYRQPPAYFHGWQLNSPPHWGQHWGKDWAERRSGWDRWQRRSAPALAPLPVYQRKFTGAQYPRLEQQPSLQAQHYRYQAHDPVVRQQQPAISPQVLPAGTGKGSPIHQQEGAPRTQPAPHSGPARSAPLIAPAAPHEPLPQKAREQAEHPAPGRLAPQRPPVPSKGAPMQPAGPAAVPQGQAAHQGASQHGQPGPRGRGEGARAQGQAQGQEHERGQGGQEKERDKSDDHGQDHKR